MIVRSVTKYTWLPPRNFGRSWPRRLLTGSAAKAARASSTLSNHSSPMPSHSRSGPASTTGLNRSPRKFLIWRTISMCGPIQWAWKSSTDIPSLRLTRLTRLITAHLQRRTSSSGVAAIHVEHMAGDHGRGRRGEEHGRAHDVRALAQATQGNVAQEVIEDGWVFLDGRRHQGCSEMRRCGGGGPDPVLRPLDRQAARQRDH